MLFAEDNSASQSWKFFGVTKWNLVEYNNTLESLSHVASIVQLDKVGKPLDFGHVSANELINDLWIGNFVPFFSSSPSFDKINKYCRFEEDMSLITPLY